MSATTLTCIGMPAAPARARAVRPAATRRREPRAHPFSHAPALIVVVLVHLAAFYAAWQWLPTPDTPPRTVAAIEVQLITPPKPVPPPPPPEPPPPPPPRPPVVKQPSPPKPAPVIATRAQAPASLVVPVESLQPLPPMTTLASLPTSDAAPIRMPAAPAVAAPVAPSLPVTPPSFNAAYLDNPPPAWPALERKRGREGRVLLRVLVSAEGHAGQVSIAQSSGIEAFDQAALVAVRRWRFVPARRGSEAIAAPVNVPIVFMLER